MRYAMIGVLLIVAGCSPKYIPPTAAAPEVHPYTINRDFGHVWDRTIDFFAEHFIPVETIERESGFISAGRIWKGEETPFADCGEVEQAVQPVKEINGGFNVRVRSVSPSSTVVQVRSTWYGTWSGKAISKDLGDDKSGALTCVSTGVFEELLAEWLTK